MRWLALAAVVSGCGGLDANPGLDAQVRVAGAQFFPGAMPAPAGAARITSLETPNNTIRAGQLGKAVSGRVTGDGRAVAFGWVGDAGYWIVPAGPVDSSFPDQLTWSARLSFAITLGDGAHDLQVAAIDAGGRLGPASTLTLHVRPHAVDLADTRLVISLSWDTEADLDLHVVLPSAPPITVWSKHPTSYVPPAPGDPVDPDALARAGTLDADSNSQCLIDGRREENVTWRGAVAAPPHGTYAVLIDTFALCGAPTAHWTADVYRDGDPTSTAHAEGIVVDSDTRGDHVAGSGARALSFDY